jgi:leucyl aminopeptidase (aminopeptidase T)
MWKPVKIRFNKGRIVGIKGGLSAFLIKKHIESFSDKNAWMVGHFSIGTDKRALWCAQTLSFNQNRISEADAESFYGNVQIEIGRNNDVNFYGRIKSKAHLGHCLLNSTVYLDNELFLDHGEFVFL